MSVLLMSSVYGLRLEADNRTKFTGIGLAVEVVVVVVNLGKPIRVPNSSAGFADSGFRCFRRLDLVRGLVGGCSNPDE